MLNLFSFTNYRLAVEAIVEEKKQLPGKWTLRRLAEETGLQPSFLTNVLKDRAEFSADQLYAVCEALHLSENERSYLLQLLDWSRSVHPSRKQDLKRRLDDMRREAQKTEKHLAVEKVDLSPDAQATYYLDPYYQLVHVQLSLPGFSANPERLATLLGISRAHLSEVLDGLVRIGYVRRERGAFKVVAHNKHLPKESPLCAPHQVLLRQKSLDQMQRLAEKEKYSFSVTFTGTDDTKAQLQEAFLGFLKTAQNLVKDAPSQKSFQMNFDLFPWEIDPRG